MKRGLKLFVLTIGVTFFTVNKGYSQAIITTDKLLPNIMSPEAASLGKYGSYDVNFYSGSPNISLPLHAISENGLQIPIILSYDASGFIPNKNAGTVGMNWNLSAGGAITRVVNGRADETYDPNPVINPDPLGYDKGYIYGQLTAGLPQYTSEFIRKIDFLIQPDQSGKYMNDPGYSPKYSLQYEYAPDVFSFNFLGHSGKFFLGNNGQVQVSSDRRYKVNLTQIGSFYDFRTNLGILSNNISKNTLNNNPFSKITMISDDGYEFTFGGAFKDIEAQFSYANPVNREVDPVSGVINAWFLTKVKTPEGTDILFKTYEYTDNDAEVIKRLFDPFGSWDNIPASFLEVKIFRSQTRIFNGTASSNTGNQYSKSLIKHCYLTEITTELQTVKFSYLPKDQVDKFYGGTIYYNSALVNRNSNYYTSKLNKIEAYDNFNGGGIPDLYQPFTNSKTINFGYINKQAENLTGNRLFLNSISINNTPYSFTYTNADNLPDPITKGVDIWGYYNGKTDNTELVGDPNQSYGVPGEYEVDLQSPGKDRRAYANVCLNGMLQSITYPTGGKTEFTFENHDYSKVLKRKVSAGITPVLESATGIAGGLRIKEIKNTPGTTTTFKYVASYEQNPNGPSSGLLIKGEVYKKDFVPSSVQGGPSDKVVSDNNISGAATYSQPYIGYKEVVEIKSDGFTKYEYTNHETNPDTYFLGSDSYKLTTERSTTNYNNQLSRLYKFSSREDERGKIRKMTVYNSVNALVKSTEYTYNTDPQRDLARTIGVYCPYSLRTGAVTNTSYLVALLHSYALYTYQNLPTSIVEKDYGSNSVNPLITTTAFSYKSNTNPLLTQKTMTLSDGSVMKYQYEYPEDFATQAPYSTMVNTKNILTPVVKETVSKDNIVLTINKHNYSEFYVVNGLNNNYLYRIGTEKTVNQTVLPNVDQEIFTVSSYTIKGMLQEARKPNDQYLAYIWDYKGLYPVAQVSNATLFDIAYTSFEADGNGGWNFVPSAALTNYLSPTGKKCYKLTGNTISVINDVSLSPHILSYWSNSGQYNVSGTQTVKQGSTVNGWTFFEHVISGVQSVSVSGSGLVDEVRIYPKGSQMTTYTYEPLSGITSKCDPNNRITYFEYDARGRLVLIRDQDKKILKKICYNYTGEVENCSATTEPTLNQTGLTRCKPCPANSNYVTNVFQRQYIDVNPQSQTFNQYTWLDDFSNTSCVASPADWQNTSTPLRCQVYNNANTGYQEQEQIDVNPCSPTNTYNQTRWVVAGYNPSACPLPACGPGNCSGDDRKCINGICEIGVWSSVSSVRKKIDGVWMWECVYKYCFTDGSYSTYSQTLYFYSPCAFLCN